MCKLEFTHNTPKGTVGLQRNNYAVKTRLRRGVTLLELMVSAAVIALLMAIMMPVLRKARQDALAVQCMDNQRNIVLVVSTFASDNDGRCPESVATIGQLDEHWNWQEPTMLISSQQLSPSLARSVSAYLHNYLPEVSIMFCPGAPKKYEYLQRAWDAGDKWDNPETPSSQDPVMGTYCLYWNYVGYLEGRAEPFKGPEHLSGAPGQSSLLVSDYFGYGHWRNKLIYNDYKAYGSCESFNGASVTPGTLVSSAYWSRWAGEENAGLDTLNVELHAGYTDGHVERYTPSQVVPMRVSITSDGTVPYPSELGPGVFYLPEDGLN